MEPHQGNLKILISGEGGEVLHVRVQLRVGVHTTSFTDKGCRERVLTDRFLHVDSDPIILSAPQSQKQEVEHRSG